MNDPSFLRVSEIGAWLYCPVSFKLHRQKVKADPESEAVLNAGVQFHHAHGRLVQKSRMAAAASRWVLAAIVLTAAVVALYFAQVL